ncbi:hypothetical protein CAEBREN_00462 [Caenorhabditis brenneri]|uniref:BAT2 N-terminal domain-containing protein n=1 Tax=Caenorhabditis brenneri TaxID=135651 RepID=G0P4H9_CAEBE|nr:hypothetical protein CAEBREN_00462 [Caenorhabditis brenneri]
MSSQNRGAQGTNKQKGVSVNNLFSGRNAPGQRGNDPSRNGMQSVGKAANVFRRMPAPASLPSLRAENNGQDPTTPVVPQGGTGWSKSDNPNGAAEPPQTPTSQQAAVPVPPPANDLRPSWLVAANAEQQTNNSQAREFPSLAPPANDSDKINKWETTSSLAERFNEMSNGDSFEGGVPTRFLGSTPNSTDAAFNAKSSTKPLSNNKYNRNSDDEGFDSQDRDRNYSTEEGGWSSNGSPSQTDSYGPDKDTDGYLSYMTNDLPHFRTSEIRILKRATEQLLLQDISDDEDDVQMTRLDKPSICVVKRGGDVRPVDTPESELSEQVPESPRSPTPPPAPKKATDAVETEEKKLVKERKSFKKIIKEPKGFEEVKPVKLVEKVPEKDLKLTSKKNNKDKKKEVEVKPAEGNIWFKNSEEKKQQAVPTPIPEATPIATLATTPVAAVQYTAEVQTPIEKVEKPAFEEIVPAPLPQENVWAKRKEERESLEREKEKSLMPRVMQQAIEHHFPKVHDSTTIKVDKESTRKSSDTEFTRAAIRARKQQTSNDVRRLINGENGVKIKLNRNGNQENDGSDLKLQKGNGPNGYNNHQNGYKNQNGAYKNNQVNGKLVENNNRERSDSHRSNVSTQHSEDNKKPTLNGQNAKTEETQKENGAFKQFNINEITNISIESWADEMENLCRCEDSDNKTEMNEIVECAEPVKPQQPVSNQVQYQTQEQEKKNKPKTKDPKQGTQLFVPKALRKEADDLPANGLLSPQNVEAKEKIAAAKCNGEVAKKVDAEQNKKPGQPNKKKGEQSVEFPKQVGKSVDITGYDFTFDPKLHQTPIMSDRAAIQKMISAENEATDDASNNRRKILTDLRQSIDGMGQFAMSKVSQDFKEPFTCRPNNLNGNNISLPAFTNPYSSFPPLFNSGDAPLLYPNTAPSPPMSYLNMMNFSNLKRQNGFGAPENGLLGRIPNPQANVAAAALAAAQHQRIWNGGHFDLGPLSGTPPANYNSNGSYGFFNNCPNPTEHRPPFGGLPTGLPNGMGNGQAPPFFDRPPLPPANLAVGSQRQANMFNSNRSQPPQQQSGPPQLMNSMNNGPGQFPSQNFQPPPPPPMMRLPPTNGASHQENLAFFFNSNRGPIPRPPGISAPGHVAQMDLTWSNSNNNHFGNAGHSNGNWNNQQTAGPSRQNGYNQRRENQQMNNRMRPTPVQGTRQ